MMVKRYQVAANFIDKYTKKYHPKGTVYETDSEERAEELRKGGFLGEEIQPKPDRAEPPKRSKSGKRKGKGGTGDESG